jgi:hypothetical protein
LNIVPRGDINDEICDWSMVTLRWKRMHKLIKFFPLDSTLESCFELLKEYVEKISKTLTALIARL